MLDDDDDDANVEFDAGIELDDDDVLLLLFVLIVVVVVVVVVVLLLLVVVEFGSNSSFKFAPLLALLLLYGEDDELKWCALK
jgi:hypothetical protein